VRRVLEILSPRRLGSDFRWLLSGNWVSNLGDGIALAAGPLLVASLTRDAFLVSLAALLQWLPKLLFGLQAGVLSDRMDRRLLVVAVNVARAAVLGVLTIVIATGNVSIAVVLAALFLVSTAEVFADNTSGTLLPMLVRRDDLPIANVRLQAGFVTVNQLIGPPVGAALFAAGRTWPFACQAVLILAGAGLVSRITLRGRAREVQADQRMRGDIVEGLRWTWHHPGVRTLALTIFIFNISFGAAFSVLVLLAQRRLHMGEVGYGLLTTASALGALAGSAVYGRVIRRISLSNLMRIGLIYETLTHLALAVNTVPGIAIGIFFLFGVHEMIWGTTSSTIRQRAVPMELQGRVNAVYSVSVFAGLVAGSGIGGVLAQALGVTAPFWFAFAGSALFVALIWRQLVHVDATP
jgi:MFS family permease